MFDEIDRTFYLFSPTNKTMLCDKQICTAAPQSVPSFPVWRVLLFCQIVNHSYLEFKVIAPDEFAWKCHIYNKIILSVFCEDWISWHTISWLDFVCKRRDLLLQNYSRSSISDSCILYNNFVFHCPLNRRGHLYQQSLGSCTDADVRTIGWWTPW